MIKQYFKVISVFITFAFCLTTKTSGQTIPVDPAVKIGKLANGLTYYIRHNEHPANRADLYLVQKTGSVVEREDQRGLAHFLEHMAFNGTEHFPGNTLISELAQKGIRFGANINASTSYDETIYKLINIPVNRQSLIDTALLVLRDWACALTLDPKEADEERNVVREEWRTRSSATLRVLERDILPVICAGTPYANRIPIGNMDVISHFDIKELQDYYRKWYRPDLQGIIIVGDVDIKQTEELLQKHFAGIPPAVHPAERKYFTVPDNKVPLVATGADPELTETTIDIYWKRPGNTPKEKVLLSYYKTKMINKMISGMLTNRFIILRQQPQTALEGINITDGNYSITSTTQAFRMTATPSEKGQTIEALKTVLYEIARLKRFGFSEAELRDYLKGALRLEDIGYESRNNRENFEYIQEYVQAFLKNEPIPDADWQYHTARNILHNIHADTINFYVRKFFREENMVFTVTGPRDGKAPLPIAAEILEARRQINSKDPVPYEYKSQSDTLPDVKPVGGKTTMTTAGPLGYTIWTLSNGIKVWFRRTDGNDRRLILRGYRPGGYSTAADTDLPSAMAMSNVINEGSISDPEGKAIVRMSVNRFDETINGQTNYPEEVKTLLQLVYLRMTDPRTDRHAYERYLQFKRQQNSGRSAVPKFVFEDTLQAIMGNHHPRSLSLNDTATLAKVDYEKMNRLHKGYFSNAHNFTFFITGNLAADSLQPLVETWLGGLPVQKEPHHQILDSSLHMPTGIIRKHFEQKMKTPQATVTIGYTGYVPFTLRNQVLMDCLTGVLTISYTSKLREQEGGTYVVWVGGEIGKFPREHFILQVNFDTAPEKKDRLIAAVHTGLKDIVQVGPAPDLLEKVKANMIKRYKETDVKNTLYWADRVWRYYVWGIDDQEDYEKNVSAITTRMVGDFAKQLIEQGNMIEVVMTPKE